MTTPVSVVWGGDTLPQLSTLSIVYDPIASVLVSYGGDDRVQYGRSAPRKIVTGTWEGLSESEFSTLETHFLGNYRTLSSLTISDGTVIPNVLVSAADFQVTPRHNPYKDHWRYTVQIRWKESKQT